MACTGLTSGLILYKMNLRIIDTHFIFNLLIIIILRSFVLVVNP